MDSLSLLVSARIDRAELQLCHMQSTLETAGWAMAMAVLVVALFFAYAWGLRRGR